MSLPMSGALTIGQVLMRLGAVEDALLVCREQLAQIRAIQPVLPSTGK